MTKTLDISIYILIDPREPQAIRYVGQTWNPKLRLGNLLSEGRSNRLGNKKRPAAIWIGELLSMGLVPEMRILETVTNREEAARVEQWWINYCKSDGWDLLTTGQTKVGISWASRWHYR